ncbi:helix-turn-helix transcriptional regulator [Nonomuraea basaltis]|uniref:helix-turn-helix transcriptional regulator n=1 Tax=Nonomuraea basaltis TaxID=2495887 RepID=UPI00110C658F|nr:helix-turn-helix transcriptional regulator [Nonomuraea basaltis]TMR88160.1 transcriptional regulator [Nonomuraea basaltis]
MNALQRLIRTRMTELNRSFSEVARRGGLPRSTVHHLAANSRPSRLPNPMTLERLSVGLEVPLDIVRSAAAEATGISMSHQTLDDPEIEVLVASLSRLTPQDRRHVAALVRSLLTADELDRPKNAP